MLIVLDTNLNKQIKVFCGSGLLCFYLETFFVLFFSSLEKAMV